MVFKKIFGIQYLISFTFIIYLGTKWQCHQTRQAKALVVNEQWTMTVKSSRNISGTSWMAIKERSFKYLDAQQVSQQISVFFKSKFHNEGGVCEKSYFEVFFWQWSHLSFPKISTFTDPPFTFFAYIPKIFDKYQMPIFFI